MSNFLRLYLIATLVIFVITSGCSSFTYTPRSKQNRHREMPSILLYEQIINFRMVQGSWPISKEDFISKNIKYYQAFEGFKFQDYSFKITDSNYMVFSFWNHIKDVELQKQNNKQNLSAYRGRVIFFKEGDKFLWKIKMH